MLKEKEKAPHGQQSQHEEQGLQDDNECMLEDDMEQDGAIIPEDRQEAHEEAEALEADEEMNQTMSSFLHIHID